MPSFTIFLQTGFHLTILDIEVGPCRTPRSIMSMFCAMRKFFHSFPMCSRYGV